MPARDLLTAAAVDNAKAREKPYKLFDGGGLYLLVQPSGSRWWRLKYRVDGVEKLISLGTYPPKSLKAARKARDEAKALVLDGVDPSSKRKADRAARRSARENTFEAVAREWHGKRSRTWAKNHAKIVIRRLEKDVFPAIGREPVSKLTGPALSAMLAKVEERGVLESAHRIRQYLDAIFRYAIQTHRLSANPTPHAETLTPAVATRFASITEPKAVGALIRAIRGYSGTPVTVAALKLAPLLFVRPGELRAAEWAEFDLDAAEWMIPAARMKMRRPHIVPLSSQALAIFRELHPLTGHRKFVFPSERGASRCLSANTLTVALRALGYSREQMTAHGFRHMASTLLHESRKWRSEAIEAQLAHADRNKVRAVYNAAEYLEERRAMLQWWADRLDALAGTDNVVTILTRRQG
jgi:integrase